MAINTDSYMLSVVGGNSNVDLPFTNKSTISEGTFFNLTTGFSQNSEYNKVIKADK